MRLAGLLLLGSTLAAPAWAVESGAPAALEAPTCAPHQAYPRQVPLLEARPWSAWVSEELSRPVARMTQAPPLAPWELETLVRDLEAPHSPWPLLVHLVLRAGAEADVHDVEAPMTPIAGRGLVRVLQLSPALTVRLVRLHSPCERELVAHLGAVLVAGLPLDFRSRDLLDRLRAHVVEGVPEGDRRLARQLMDAADAHLTSLLDDGAAAISARARAEVADPTDAIWTARTIDLR